jgi:radical SAM protein (TIGR01212 family)
MKFASEIKGVRTLRRVDAKVVDSMYRDGFLYAQFGEYMKRSHGVEVFKVPFDASFTCPNWDGRLSSEGCVFCPAQARQFTYESFRAVINKSLREQLSHQVAYYKKRGAGEKALVYVAFGTNTYLPLKDLKRVFDAAVDHPDVIGLSVGTRPDCLPDEVLDLLGGYVGEGYEVWLELGQQSVHYHTAERINRRHGLSELASAIRRSKERGILNVVFLIFGLPYETPAEAVETARVVSGLSADAVKLYPLLVMKNTRLAREYGEGKYTPISAVDYAKTVADFLEHLHPHVLVQRVSKDCGLDGKDAPEWNTHRFIVGPRVEKILQLRGTRQGAKYSVGLSASELVPLEKAKKYSKVK